MPWLSGDGAHCEAIISHLSLSLKNIYIHGKVKDSLCILLGFVGMFCYINNSTFHNYRIMIFSCDVYLH